MTLNLTELKDEPLGKHPKHAFTCGVGACLLSHIDGLVAEQVDVADDESVFKFDFDGLSDEMLDPPPAVYAAVCVGLCRSGVRLAL